MNKQPQTIELTPTWFSVLPALLEVYEKADTDGRRQARQELTNMAKAADEAGRALKCLRAIQARVQGEWDSPELQAVGALHAEVERDIPSIIKHYFGGL